MSRIMEELLEETIKKREKEIAISLLKDGMSQAKVAMHSGLTSEEVEALAKQGKKAFESTLPAKASSEPLLELLALKRMKESGDAPGFSREEVMEQFGIAQEQLDTMDDVELE